MKLSSQVPLAAVVDYKHQDLNPPLAQAVWAVWAHK
jgi:hypothetical protein